MLNDTDIQDVESTVIQVSGKTSIKGPGFVVSIQYIAARKIAPYPLTRRAAERITSVLQPRLRSGNTAGRLLALGILTPGTRPRIVASRA
jgi:hypothetical protein